MCIQFTFTPDVVGFSRTAVHIVYVALCSTGSLQTTAIGNGSSLNPQMTGLAFPLTATCLQDSGTITIHNPSALAGIITSITLVDTASPFTLLLPPMPIPFPADTTITIPVTFAPLAQGAYTDDVDITFTPRDSMQQAPFVTITGSAQPAAVTASIRTTLHADPAESFAFNILVNLGLAQLPLHVVRGTVKYDPSVLFLTGYDIRRYRSFRICDGYVCD